MKYVQRQRFWWFLFAGELGAFPLSAVLATGLAALFVLVGLDARHFSAVAQIAGPIINIYLAYSVFRSLRDRAMHWPVPETRGFPVVMNTTPTSE